MNFDAKIQKLDEICAADPDDIIAAWRVWDLDEHGYSENEELALIAAGLSHAFGLHTLGVFLEICRKASFRYLLLMAEGYKAFYGTERENLFTVSERYVLMSLGVMVDEILELVAELDGVVTIEGDE